MVKALHTSERRGSTTSTSRASAVTAITACSARTASGEVAALRGARRSDIDGLHLRDRIARAGGGTHGDGLRGAGHVVRVEPNFQRGHVLVHPALALGAGDGNDVRSLSEEPGEHELGRRAALLGREFLDAVHELDVVLEVLLLEARVVAASIALGDVLELLELSGEQAAPDGRVGDEGDAELTTHGQ